MQTDTSAEKYNIICLSNQLWSWPLWTNKRHAMTRLVALGNNVIFVDPPINTGRLFFRQLLLQKWSLRRLITQVYLDGKVSVVTPLDWNPKHEKLARVHVNTIKNAVAEKFDPKRRTILWVYHVEIPGLKSYLEELNYDLLIYDCVDNYAGFPKYNTPEKKAQVDKQEQYLATKADLVFATAPGLVEKLKKYNQNVHYTPNVGDYDMFSKSRDLKNTLPEDLVSIPRPRIGFTGAVDEYKFDRRLVKRIAQDYPNYSFVIIGPMALKDRGSSLEEIGMSDLRNVYFLGTKQHKDTPQYFAGFDAYIIPYQLNDYTVGGCFPVKFHESLAAGLPTIVTDLPAYAPFSEVCYIAKSHQEFSQYIRRALEEDNEIKIKERQKVAKENSWEGKIKHMLSLISLEFSKA